MPNPLKPRRSYTPNSVPQVTGNNAIAQHELAINWQDGKLFTRDANDNLVTLTVGGSGGGGGGGGGGGEDTLLRSLFVPPAPTSLTATAGNAQVALSWTAPTVLAQTPITDYVVQYSSNSGSTWTTFSDGTSTATSATVTGLTNGTAYVFRVAAVNGVGTGAYTAASGSVTPQAAVFRAIPAMTSTTTPSGVVSTNGTPGSALYWRNFIYDGAGSDIWRIFDGSGNPGGKFDPANNSGVPVWIQYAFPEGQTSAAGGYRIKARTPDGGQAPPSVLLQGSSDGSTWSTVDTRSGLSWSADESKTFTFGSTATWRYWRWTVTAGSAGYADVGDIQLIAP